MTRHTPETVRAACERAGIQLNDDVPTVRVSQTLHGCARWTATTGGGGRVVVDEIDGELWYAGRQLTDHYHANEQRAETLTPDHVAANAALREQVRVLREALAPFAVLAEAYTDDAHDDAIVLRYEQASGRRTLTIGNLRTARAALGAK